VAGGGGSCPAPNRKPGDHLDCDRAPLDPGFVSCVAGDPSMRKTRDPTPPATEGCTTCHAQIESAHPYLSLSCTDCHGGDPKSTDKATAHVALPTDTLCGVDVSGLDAWGRVKTLRSACATDQLDALAAKDGGALLRFVNPGDLRVAAASCGSSNPQAGGGGCHQPVVETAQRSVMQTFVGHYNLPRFLAGMQPTRDAIVGSTTVSDAGFNPLRFLSVAAIKALRGPEAGAAEGSLPQVMDEYLPRHCPTCHTGSFGRNDSDRNYRSSGCTACHMLYDDTGGSTSQDLATRQEVAATGPRPVRHVLTTRIPTRQCEHCHYQGARIGLNFQGLREHGFTTKPYMSAAQVAAFEEAETRMSFVKASIHGHGEKWYACDEDATAPEDETPPDVHFQRGMHCADCHTQVDVHGDGHLYSTAKGQLDVHCTDCHGTVRAPAAPGADGKFRTARRGSELEHLRLDAYGGVILTGRVDGAEHPVTQIHDRLEARSKLAGADQDPMVRAMGVHPRTDGTDFSHTDTLECWTCHTSWRLNCYGCHVSQSTIQHEDPDWKSSQPNNQTGGFSNRVVKGDRYTWDISNLFLGMNDRGKIDTMCPSMQMFVSSSAKVYNPTTDTYQTTTTLTHEPRRNAKGQPNFGWMPTHQHTIQARAQPCTRCHPLGDQSNLATVRATYGFGAGVTVPDFVDETGQPYDLSKMLDETGEPISDFAHEGTGPVPAEVRERAMATTVAP
jgi:hypothetical protein